MQLMNSLEYLHWLDENQKRVSKWKRRKHTKRYLPRKSQLGYYFGLPEFCNLTSEDEGPEAEMPEREECSQEKENRKPLRNFDPYNTAVPNITFSMEKNLSVFHQPLEMTNKLTETTDDTDSSQPVDKRRSSCQSQKGVKKRITNFDPYNMTIPDITFDTENNITVFRHTHRDSQESETASFSQSTEEMRQSMDNAGLSQSQEMLKKRPTNFDPYNQTAPEITFNTENAISYFQSCGGSQVSEVVSISQSSQEISQPVTEEGSSQHQEQPANCHSEVRNISNNISETYYGEITGSQISVTKANDLTVERESIRCDQETENASFSQFGQEASQPAEEKENSKDHLVTIDPDNISLKDSMQEKEVMDQPKTLAASTAKWKTPFTLPPEVQIQTPQENLLASELTLGPSENHQNEANEAHEASDQVINPKNIPTREEIQEKEVIAQNQISKIPSDTSSKWKTAFTLSSEVQFSNSQENLSSHDPCLTPQKEPQTDQITTPIQDSTMVSIYNTTIHMNDKENSRILDFNKSQKKLTLTPKNEPPETPKSCSRFAKNQANFGANKSIGCQITPVPAEKSRRRTSVCSMEISKNPSPSRSPSRQSSVNLTKRTRSIAFAAVSDAATSPHHPKFDRRRSMLGIQIPFEENNSRRISVFKNDNNRRRPSIFVQKNILKNSTIDEGTNTESIASPPAKKLASLSTHKPLIPTFGQVSKLIPKRAENESLRKITDYSSPQTFPTPPRFTNALLQLREYNTPKSGPRGMIKKTNIFTPIETTPKSSTKNRTSRLSKNFSHATLSTTINQENGEENEEKQDESFKLADQLKHRLIFEDSQDMGSDYWGSTAKSIQDETEVDEREKGRFSSQNFEENDEDDHQPDVIGCDEWNFNNPSPSSSGSRKSSIMAKLLNESITATEVSTPKPLSRTAMLRWATQTPGQPQTPGQSRKHDRFVVTNKNLDKDTESVTNSPSTNSPPVKHVVFGRGKSPEYILAKPKIHTYEPNVIDSRLGIRRSNRNKVRTLRPWLNEKPVYQADAEGNQTLVDVQTKEVKEKRAKKFLTADPKEQFERELEQKARRKKRQDLAMEMKLHHKKF